LIPEALGALLLIAAATPASAWQRGHTEIFAILSARSLALRLGAWTMRASSRLFLSD
jgi:hypothetical protein